MTEQELYNEYRKSDCKSFTDFLINKITELKKTYSKQRNKRIDDLQKKNAELDCQKNRNKFCYSCANATERCFKNEIGCPCGKYKSYKDENAELKDELKKWKDEWQEQVQKATDEGYARTLQTMQLTKAKELLKRAQGYTENLDDKADELYDEIEQLLNSEVNK